MQYAQPCEIAVLCDQPVQVIPAVTAGTPSRRFTRRAGHLTSSLTKQMSARVVATSISRTTASVEKKLLSLLKYSHCRI